MLELIMAAQTVILLCMAARIAFDAIREHRRKAGKADAVQGRTQGRKGAR